MSRTAVINVVGLTDSLLGPRMPRLHAFARSGPRARIRPAFPAVTCTAQSNYLTGATPSGHGIVANGWYDRDLAEVQFWKQSNHLVQREKVWETLRSAVPGFTCAQLFWWYNMYASVDYSITPRPIYPADGRKIFDIYTWPYEIRPQIKKDLGAFPFPAFWGPAAGVPSRFGAPDAASRWIAFAARWMEERHQPTLSLIYLPHLDYNLQRLGPEHPEIETDLRAIDQLAGDLIDFYRSQDVQTLVVSEYGITPVRHPVHLNRLFRGQGWLVVKEDLGQEQLDAGASRVFAVADHQVAHVYVQDPALLPKVRSLLEARPEVAAVLGKEEKRQAGLDHPRAGDLVVAAREDAWFTYYFWREDEKAPDYARCVDIHRKPGYDPVELFFDPRLSFPQLEVMRRLLRSRLGFRTLMDLIPLDASLVRGSHGVVPSHENHWPLILTGPGGSLPTGELQSTDVRGVIESAVKG